MMRLEGKVAVVTGGASGIGLAAVEAFFKNGAKVVLSDYNDEGANIAQKLGSEDQVRFFKADVSNEEDVKQLFEKTKEWFGPVDIAFANAGIGDIAAIHELDLDRWKRMIDINLTGVYLTDKYAIQQMLDSNKGGAVINNASILGHVGQAAVTSYTAAKGGVVNMTRTLGVTYASKGIRVNAVCPGYVETAILNEVDQEMKQALVGAHPIGRLGRPEEIANAVVFLASDEASFVVGANLLVDGGYTAQ